MVCVPTYDYLASCRVIDASDISDFETNYKPDAQSIDNETDAVALGAPSVPQTSDGCLRVQIDLTEGRRCYVTSHNFCKKETWYQKSERITDETLSTTNQTVYTPAVSRYWIDVTHGKLFAEYELQEYYAPVIKVNGTTKKENPPGTTSGDFSINYATGAVTFNSALYPADVVTASYSYPTSSMFTMGPAAGYKQRVSRAEIQLSKDLVLTDTACIQLWGLADVFAPGQLPPGTMIPVARAEKYQTVDDYAIDGERSYPEVPVISAGANWRHHSSPRVVYHFDYIHEGTVDMWASYGMEIRLWLENDTPFEGEAAVVTFYGSKLPE